jgi:HSP20 family molecular chaperone IbpA
MNKTPFMLSCLLSANIYAHSYITPSDLLEWADLLSENSRYWPKGATWSITEQNGYLLVDVEVPGYEKNEVHVKLLENGRVLSIEAKRENAPEEKEQNNTDNSKVRNSANRTFKLQGTLPYAVQEDAKATLKNGILSVSLKKVDKPSHRIEIE